VELTVLAMLSTPVPGASDEQRSV